MKILYLGKGVFVFRCPGCNDLHFIYTKHKNSFGAVWKYSGDENNPTFHPSVNYTTGNRVPKKFLKEHEWKYYQEQNTGSQCHFFIKNGKIDFQNDCTHKMNGVKGILLPELTEEQIDNWASTYSKL